MAGAVTVSFRKRKGYPNLTAGDITSHEILPFQSNNYTPAGTLGGFGPVSKLTLNEYENYASDKDNIKRSIKLPQQTPSQQNT